jgi:hypothetical protein
VTWLVVVATTLYKFSLATWRRVGSTLRYRFRVGTLYSGLLLLPSQRAGAIKKKKKKERKEDLRVAWWRNAWDEVWGSRVGFGKGLSVGGGRVRD